MSADRHDAAWDLRDRLLEELKQTDCVPARTLYIRRDDGGALGIGLLPEQRGVALFEWRNTSYELKVMRKPEMRLEPYELKSVGFGGIFGIGEKGGNGWKIRMIECGKDVAEVILLPNITSYADLLAKNDRFLYGKRKPRYIPLWQLQPDDRFACAQTVALWEKLICEGKV
jgi:hypothetical protein